MSLSRVRESQVRDWGMLSNAEGVAQGAWEGHRGCLRGGDAHTCTGQVRPSHRAWRH